MNFDAPFSDFLAKMSSIRIYQASVKDIAKQQEKNFRHQLEIVAKTLKKNDVIVRISNPALYSAMDKVFIPYSCLRQNIGDKLQELDFITNRHYQWLLADAFEALEKLVRSIYIELEMSGLEVWDARDYRQKHKAVPLKDYAYLQGLVRNKPCSDMLKQIRKKVPQLSQFEQVNLLEVNLYLEVLAVEKFRHQIVHAGGRIVDPDEFIKNLASAAQCKKELAKNQLGRFVRRDKGGAYINLVDVRSSCDSRVFSLFSEIFDNIVSYGHLMCSIFDSEIRQGNWSRIDTHNDLKNSKD